MNTELKSFRYYQTEADEAIYQELLTANKCIVKMFCGTGKSLLMRECKSVQKQKLVVYVFPSLSLIDQFCTEYFTKIGLDSPFKISSENDSTTDPVLIKAELKRRKNKIICVTYQSYKTLLDNLGSIKIDVCIYDEAHHAVAPTYQELIFEHNACEKQIFFTATPKDDNGIVMCDKDAGICGRTVYDYSYLRGLTDECVNPFEIRVDMYTENTNKSVYESIARAILVSGNNRVLTFHADVNTERDSSVLNFVNEKEFDYAFNKVLKNEFPEKTGLYTRFKMIALDSDKPPKCNSCRVVCEEKTYNVSCKTCCRYNILNKFDTTLDNEVYIISSCETIGEGIDTKNANMCVFVDPKSSFVKIIQNIGRIVRPQSKPSTVLIPCWVDREKYVGCDEDREKCDEVIRQDLNKDGNFNGILNVLSALRQEDEDLYDICLHYPDTYSPQEIKSNLEKHGYKVLDPVGDGELIETMEYLLDTNIDSENYEDCETNEEMIMRIAEDNDVCVEVHTNSFENQIEKYNSECESGEVIRLYKEEYDEEEEEENQVYCPVVKKCGKRRGEESIKELNRKDRIKIDVHTNPDVKVLWKLVGDFTKEICSCVLECEVMCYDDRWFKQFEELKKFIDDDKNKRRPNKESCNAHEKQLGHFMTNTIRNYKYNKDGMKKEDRRCLWEQFCKDYNKYMPSDDDIWFSKLSELITYFVDNEKRPSDHSTKIGKWLLHQIEYYNSNTMPENRIEKWEQFWNAHSKYFIGLQDKWFERFNQYEQYIIKHESLPLVSKSLGRWGKDNDKSMNDGKMNNERFNKWNELKRKYSELFQDIWFENLIELSLFIKTHTKLPVYLSFKQEEERVISQWNAEQINDYKTKMQEAERKNRIANWNNKQINDYKTKTQGMKDKIKYEKWTEHILFHNKLYLTREDVWLITYEKTAEYIENKGKRPSAKNPDEKIKELGVWLSNNLLKLTKKKKDLILKMKNISLLI